MIRNDSIKGKTLYGLFWSFMDLFTIQGIQFLSLLILARILLPEHFGLIGMLTLFIAISNILIDSGFTQALIREKYVTQQDYSTVFFFNLIMSFSLYVLLFFLAPLIGAFFESVELVKILKVLSLGIIINSFGVIQRVQLVKNLNFKLQTKITFFAACIAFCVAILLAMNGFGVWSLVGQSLTLQIVQTVLLWIYNKWTPEFTFKIVSFKRMFGFGSKLLASSLIDTIYNNIFSVIIGKFYPAAQLGYYTNAAKITDIATGSITGALQRVTYPVLSTIQDDEQALGNSFKKYIRITAYVMFPLMAGLIAIADSFVPLLLGPNWTQSIIYFKLLCIVGMLYPLHAINLNILQVKGRSDLFLKLEIIKKTLLTLLVGGALFFSLGIIGLIGAAIVSSYLSFFINTYYSAKEITYATSQQIKDILPSFLISVLMCGVVYVIGMSLSISFFVKIVIQICSGVLFYVGLSWVLKIKELEIIFRIFLPFIQKIRKRVVDLLRRNIR